MLDETPAHTEMWAGVECTLNRVADCYRDQLEVAGHYSRPSDIDALIGLGVRSIRYPVLWERHAADDRAWAHSDYALARFREAGIEPIVGLVHHGSGPRHCTLLDRAFPGALAGFARTVAHRYPWLKRFTPVNEPLTTARFAALYGHWYPHHRSDRSFVRALLHQIRGIQESMRAIREVIPHAELIATEDLGYTFASADLQSQADFENHRRWLTWDLLNGRVDRSHALWKYLTDNGAEPNELHNVQKMSANETPDSLIVGVNHYLTSERYLDSDRAKYPVGTHGGNGRRQYADVEAVRVLKDGPLGIASLLVQTWERYKRPIAVTEAHLGCTREQQVLWLDEVWRAARQVRSEGADIRAVTAWAAFGSFDWNSLLTRNDGSYESGLFAVEDNALSPTALAHMVTGLAATGSFAHPGLHAVPWWHSPTRVHFACAPRDTSRGGMREIELVTKSADSPFAHQTLLIVEHTAAAGAEFAALVRGRGLSCDVVSRDQFQWLGTRDSNLAESNVEPWAIVHIAGEADQYDGGLLMSDPPDRMHALVDRLLDGDTGVTQALVVAASVP